MTVAFDKEVPVTDTRESPVQLKDIVCSLILKTVNDILFDRQCDSVSLFVNLVGTLNYCFVQLFDFYCFYLKVAHRNFDATSFLRSWFSCGLTWQV